MANSKDSLLVLTTLNFKEGNSKSDLETKPVKVTDFINKYDPLIFCRTCANADPCLVPIFKEEGLDYSLNKKIAKYLPIQVTEKDDLPLHLCYHCASTLIAWDTLVIGCVEAEKKLTLMKDSFENKKDEEVSRNVNEAMQKNIDSDDEPLITKKKITILTKNEEKRDILQEKNDLQLFEPVEMELERLMEEPDLSFSTYQHIFTMSRPFIFKIFSLRIANPFCCEMCSAVLKLKFAFVRSVREFNGKKNCSENIKAESEDGNSEITRNQFRNETKRKRFFKSECRVACGNCGKLLSGKLSLKNHMKTHLTEKPQICGACGKVFRHRFNLLRHVRVVHEGVRDHACLDCGKRFRSQGEMEDHRNVHSLQRKIVCEECGRIFLTKAAFYPHKTSHRKKGHEKNVGRFDCGECHKKFTTKKSRNQHMLIHTGEKPIVCGVCGKKFRTKANLSQHAKIHSNVKPFGCEHCGKAFARKDHLKIHIRCHTGEKPFACEYCGKGFAQINDKKKHSKTHEKKLFAT